MLDPSAGGPAQFSPAEDQGVVRDMARSFAAGVFAPQAPAWDEAKHFPVAEKIVRDWRAHQIVDGTNEIMRLIVASVLVGR